MKISEKWLREFCNPNVSTKVMADQLTMAGLEIESIETPDIDYTNMVVAQVIETEKHPDADKLTVCKIDSGDDSLLQVICGASNVRKNLKVALAKVGAKFPQLKIKKAKLRGVESYGMLCSEKELGLADESAGIMELPSDAPVGENIADFLELNDRTIDISITPNRGDCASVLGVARELSALNSVPVTIPEPVEICSVHGSTITAIVENSSACPAYLLREISNIDNTISSPIWMQQRLRQSGIRSISAVVDILNYVMIELGQPMHAFDRVKLSDKISVRFAKQGEAVSLLDEDEVNLTPNELVICDENNVLALAGVMGGSESAVERETTSVVLESAHFAPEVIAKCVRRLHKHSDSSYRFERGVDPELSEKALHRATQLILDITGGVAADIVSVGKKAASKDKINLSHDKLNRLLGVDIESSFIEKSLKSLNMMVTKTADGWCVAPPSYRFDITIEQDLIEEVVRLYGYDKVPEYPSASKAIVAPNVFHSSMIKNVRQLLANKGYSEVITYSFVDKNQQSILLGDVSAVAVNNPISSEMNVMRVSLWPGLIQALSHNLKRQQERVRLFEYGKSFIKTNGELLQFNQLAGVATGAVLPEQWGVKSDDVDFFDVKSDVLALLSRYASLGSIEFVSVSHISALHPGQAAEIRVNGKCLGFMGALHPQLMKKCGVKQPAVLFEINLDDMPDCQSAAYQPISKFPSVRRDIAIIVDQNISSGDLMNLARKQLEACKVEINLFDFYEGDNIPKGKKSLAISFTFTEENETLTDEAVAKRMERVLNSLRVTYEIELRE